MGEKEPEVIDDGPEVLTEQELLEVESQQEEHLEAMMEEQRMEAREKRRKRYQRQKEVMATPIDPLPEKELCEYEKLRNSNIREREKAMAESGFFDDLIDYKKKIGLLK